MNFYDLLRMLVENLQISGQQKSEARLLIDQLERANAFGSVSIKVKGEM